MWPFSRSGMENSPVGPSHLQYSVPLLKVTHVALLTQGALSSMHCRAATDNNKQLEGEESEARLLSLSATAL